MPLTILFETGEMLGAVAIEVMYTECKRAALHRDEFPNHDGGILSEDLNLVLADLASD